MAKGKAKQLKVQQIDDKFAVEDDQGKVLAKADTDQEAEAELKALEAQDDDSDEAKDDSVEAEQNVTGSAATTTPKSEHNPHGLDIHERFARLLVTLKRMGVHHSEDAHPAQNAQTTPGNFAK